MPVAAAVSRSFGCMGKVGVDLDDRHTSPLEISATHVDVRPGIRIAYPRSERPDTAFDPVAPCPYPHI